jgi:hypothetical protein
MSRTSLLLAFVLLAGCPQPAQEIDTEVEESDSEEEVDPEALADWKVYDAEFKRLEKEVHASQYSVDEKVAALDVLLYVADTALSESKRYMPDHKERFAYQRKFLEGKSVDDLLRLYDSDPKKYQRGPNAEEPPASP